MKVAFVLALDTPYRNAFLSELAVQEGLDVTAIYCSQSGPGQEWVLPCSPYQSVILDGVSAGGSRGGFNAYLNWGVGAALNSCEPELVVVGGYAIPTIRMAIHWASRRRIPYALLSESHSLPRRSRLRQFASMALSRGAIRRAALTFGASSRACDELVRRGAHPERVFTLPNSPDVQWFARNAHCRAGDDLTRFLFVGRLVSQKDPVTLLEGFAQARSQNGNISLTIAGSGPLQKRIEQSVRRLNLERCVTMTGFVQPTDLPYLYSAHDVFVLPSISESFGVVVLEAMACGLPVVLSDHVGSAPDLVSTETGATFKAGKPAELARALLQIAEREDRDQMKTSAKRRALEWDLAHCASVFRQAISPLV